MLPAISRRYNPSLARNVPPKYANPDFTPFNAIEVFSVLLLGLELLTVRRNPSRSNCWLQKTSYRNDHRKVVIQFLEQRPTVDTQNMFLGHRSLPETMPRERLVDDVDTSS